MTSRRLSQIDTCANCGLDITEGQRAVYDDHAELNFCDNGCFRDWAGDKGSEKVLAFYRSMNIHDVNY